MKEKMKHMVTKKEREIRPKWGEIGDRWMKRCGIGMPILVVNLAKCSKQNHI